MGQCFSTLESDDATGQRARSQTADVRVLKAQALHQQGKTEQALKELAAVIQTYPTCTRAYLERGAIRTARQEWQLVADDASKVIHMHPDSVAALHMRSQALLKLNSISDAMDICLTAMRLDPDNAQLKLLRRSIASTAHASSQQRSSSHAAGLLDTASSMAKASAGPLARLKLAANKKQAADSDDEIDIFSAFDTPKGLKVAQDKTCVVCMDNPRGCRLRPCMHGGMCAECAEGLKKRGFTCPVCGQKIEHVEIGAFMMTFAVDDPLESQGLPGTPIRCMSPALVTASSSMGSHNSHTSTIGVPTTSSIVSAGLPGSPSIAAASEEATTSWVPDNN